MTFRSTNVYKYGFKTTSEVNALAGMIQGDTVYNTDINKVEWYNGSVWTNDDCIVLSNITLNPISEGQVVRAPTSTTPRACSLATDATENQVVGVAFRGSSGGGGDTDTVIATKGLYNVLLDASGATTGHFVDLTATAGTGISTITSAAGVYAMVMENRVGVGLAKCFIQPIETF